VAGKRQFLLPRDHIANSSAAELEPGGDARHRVFIALFLRRRAAYSNQANPARS